MKTEVNRCNNT